MKLSLVLTLIATSIVSISSWAVPSLHLAGQSLEEQLNSDLLARFEEARGNKLSDDEKTQIRTQIQEGLSAQAREEKNVLTSSCRLYGCLDDRSLDATTAHVTQYLVCGQVGLGFILEFKGFLCAELSLKGRMYFIFQSGLAFEVMQQTSIGLGRLMLSQYGESTLLSRSLSRSDVKTRGLAGAYVFGGEALQIRGEEFHLTFLMAGIGGGFSIRPENETGSVTITLLRPGESIVSFITGKNMN